MPLWPIFGVEYDLRTAEHLRMSTLPETTPKEMPLRPTVQVHLPDGKVIEGPRGTQLESFLNGLDSPASPIVGGVVNGELRELNHAVVMDA
jgi:hypothetical protein